MENKPKLSILVATTSERKEMFKTLMIEFSRQIQHYNLVKEIEVVFNFAEKNEMSIGKKRQLLLEEAKGDYICYFDDDDFPAENYISLIYEAIKEGIPDCLGYKIKMTTNGDPNSVQWCDHSLRHKSQGWQTAKKGFDYIRNVTHFNVVKRELALKVGFTDTRFGEDKIYSDKVTRLCKVETYIETPDGMFQYRYSNKVAHNEKYGING